MRYSFFEAVALDPARSLPVHRLMSHDDTCRQLAAALLASIRATTIDLRPHTPIRMVRSLNQPIEVHTPTSTLHPSIFVDCTGAWAITASRLPHLRVTPSNESRAINPRLTTVIAPVNSLARHRDPLIASA